MTTPLATLLATFRHLFRVRVVGIVFCVFLWEGLIASIISGNSSQHKQLVACVIGALAIYRFLFSLHAGKLNGMETVSYFLFLYCIFVSAVSNTWIFPSDLQNWFFSLYSIVPVLLLPALRAANFKYSDVIDALLVVGVISSMLVVADILFKFPFLDIFSRGETERIDRKIVLLKTEAACSLIVLFVKFAETRAVHLKAIYGVLSGIIAVNLFLVTESRLALAAIAIAIFVTLIFLFKGRTQVTIAMWIAAAGLLFAPALLGNFVARFVEFFSSEQAVQADAGLAWRAQTFSYFYGYFEQTGGLGFGLMSSNASANNLISWAMNYSGLSYGIGNYWMNIADNGLWSALMQFGVLGLVLVCGMTGYMAWTLMSYGRRFREFHEMFALGALALAYMISPLPMNFFTLEWTAMAGNLLWALAALVSAEKRSPQQGTSVIAMERGSHLS